jgi:hypothetical protein
VAIHTAAPKYIVTHLLHTLHALHKLVHVLCGQTPTLQHPFPNAIIQVCERDVPVTSKFEYMCVCLTLDVQVLPTHLVCMCMRLQVCTCLYY